MDSDVSGHVIVITGVGSGLGEAAARLPAAQGARIVPGARRADRLGRSASRRRWLARRVCSGRSGGTIDQKGISMPHVVIKLQSGRTDSQKGRIAEAVTSAVMATAGCTEDAVSVAIEDVAAGDWMATVYEPEIVGKAGTLFKTPGYGRR